MNSLKRIHVKILLGLFAIFFVFLFIISPALAQCPPSSRGESSSEVCIDNPIQTATPQQLIGKVIAAVLGISGSLALLMFVYGGFVWMLSGGNSEKVTKGKNTLVWAAIGLVVIFSSYALVNAIFTGLT
ncbi:MAG: pilin [Patescibacteria group bacterium]|jgi:pilus assembly protein TadC|nr:pilin [Patescibacteria group bacterium]